MLRSILYVSNSALVFSDDGSRIADIVDFSRGWNASVGITGALISSEQHFVQFIEGPPPAIDDLITNLKADRRHNGLHIVRDGPADARHFGDWSLAYSGPDTFIDRDLMPLLQDRDAAGPALAANLLSRLRAMADV